MPEPFKDHIELDIRDSTADRDACLPAQAPEGARNSIDQQLHLAAAMARD